MYHRDDGSQHAEEANQFVIPPLLSGPENHLFRQDIDAYMMHVAASYGATVRQGLRVGDIETDDMGVTIHTEGGETIRARYLVDASGHGSPLARGEGLREDPTRLEHQSRALFTHMVGVEPYDDCVRPPGAHKMPIDWFQTTLHHVFDGGWMWVIPFNNHAKAVNPLCSVGLMLDPRRWPKDGRSGEEEFRAFIERFPSLDRQFARATAVRPWVSTSRLQFSSSRTTGPRYCLMSHASGFVDPLFSRGLANTADVINALMWRLLGALDDDDFSPDRFEYIERLQQGLLDFNDQLVSTAFESFVHYDLWNAWVRVWALGRLGSTNSVCSRPTLAYKKTRDDAVLRALEEVDYPGLVCPDYEQFKELWDRSRALIRRATQGGLDPREAARRVFREIEQAGLISPAVGLHDPAHRHTAGDLVTSFRVLTWGKFTAPPEIRERYYSIPTSSLVGLALSNARDIAVAR